MKKINKHYFDFLTAEIVSVEDLLQQYFTDGNACMEKSFNEYLQELLDADLWKLEDALQFFDDLLEQNIYCWKKDCKSIDILPTSIKGVGLWYDEYSENFMENKEYMRKIEKQISEDSVKERMEEIMEEYNHEINEYEEEDGGLLDSDKEEIWDVSYKEEYEDLARQLEELKEEEETYLS